ncbi:hypothetical protein [Streptomyces chromofuscus]|uniref:Uncharacterized protein n=1 Tax=Streptomyces chromofuscus TaxID=42881 RepID=A0A7M2TKW5_STRCW|nr:hypothetical protein [Streptomyces chromofuscus]QOV47911.1 hypothetical protein IPT68_05305 [Streptomyces chromofuscus]GGS98077.1 hypothetical protein GCM10010254_17550 [Streptomyces chromofuscus]
MVGLAKKPHRPCSRRPHGGQDRPDSQVDGYLLTGALDTEDVTCAPHATPKP